ncbi:Oxidoreductase OS=Streptomyces fumanus OX=67302 GN=GCM10018772_54540 PE=3 SV=1 [Streptomyces fumanus]
MTNWLLNSIAGDDFVQDRFQARQPAKLRDFEYTDVYLTPEQVRAHVEEAGLPAR